LIPSAIANAAPKRGHYDIEEIAYHKACSAAPFQDRSNKELDYRLIKEMWAFGDNRIAVRFAYEWHDDSGNWFRSYGNENCEFDAAGVMQRRIASINDLSINEADRKYRWPLGRRPDDHAGLSELGV